MSYTARQVCLHYCALPLSGMLPPRHCGPALSHEIDQMQRQTDMQIQQAVAQGAASADMAERGGAAMLQGAEISRKSTLLGMAAGDYGGASAGVQAAFGNQMAAIGMGAQMHSARMGMFGQIIGLKPSNG